MIVYKVAFDCSHFEALGNERAYYLPRKSNINNMTIMTLYRSYGEYWSYKLGRDYWSKLLDNL